MLKYLYEKYLELVNGLYNPEDSLSDIILNSYNQYNSFLNELTLLQHWSFINLIGFWVILLCLLTITNIMIGDQLIEKYKLNEKHPILTKLLKYRGILKRNSLIFNFLWIYFMIIILLIFNLLPFIIPYWHGV